MKKISLILLLFIFSLGCSITCQPIVKEGMDSSKGPQVKLGIDVLMEKQLALIKGNNVTFMPTVDHRGLSVYPL